MKGFVISITIYLFVFYWILVWRESSRPKEQTVREQIDYNNDTLGLSAFWPVIVTYRVMNDHVLVPWNDRMGFVLDFFLK